MRELLSDIPAMLSPLTCTSTQPFMEERPCTCCCFCVELWSEINVPGAVGLKVLRILIGMPRSKTG